MFGFGKKKAAKSATENLDDNVGRIIRKLEETDMLFHTHILFFSDHGDYTGDYGLVEKAQNSFEDSITRVPLIVKLPGEGGGCTGITSAMAELLDLQKGEDEVTWHVEDGKVVVRKVTKTYAGGFDFESEEIEQRLRAYEEQYRDFSSDEDLDFEEAQARAREQYERDKAARKAYKENKRRV